MDDTVELYQVLANQKRIMECLERNGLLSTSSVATSSSEDLPIPAAVPSSSSVGLSDCTSLVGDELSLEQLQEMQKGKKAKTTSGYFGVMLLKTLTSADQRKDCTVYGEGKKSKGLDSAI